MKIAVTGAAGFIGSHFCDFFLAKGFEVAGIDNFVTGQERFIEKARQSKAFQFHKLDLFTESGRLNEIFAQLRPDIVVHLAANADVRFGLEHPRKDLEQNTIVTFNVLEACRLSGVGKIAFSSTGSVYGEPKVFPTPEDCPFPVQTSLYGASKLACEGMIQAYAEGYGVKGYIFRFVSILGERYSHGHVYDFVKKLLNNPDEIQVLGDGKQRKAYLYVADCVNAVWTALSTQENKLNVYNIGPDEFIDVNGSLDVICKKLNVSPRRLYTGGERGWVGDSPFIFLSAEKLKKTGWKSTLPIRDGVARTVDYLMENKWLLESRHS